MAYRDSSGSITIDQDEAKKDIRNIDCAIADIERSAKTLKNVLDQAASGKGKTNDAIIDKATILLSRCNKAINGLTNIKNQINNTVAKYQRIDAILGERMSHSGGGNRA